MSTKNLEGALKHVIYSYEEPFFGVITEAIIYSINVDPDEHQIWAVTREIGSDLGEIHVC